MMDDMLKLQLIEKLINDFNSILFNEKKNLSNLDQKIQGLIRDLSNETWQVSLLGKFDKVKARKQAFDSIAAAVAMIVPIETALAVNMWSPETKIEKLMEAYRDTPASDKKRCQRLDKKIEKLIEELPDEATQFKLFGELQAIKESK